MELSKPTFLNTLSIRIFALFWLAFVLLFALIFVLPYFDSRIYSNLDNSEISSYNAEISAAIRTNQLRHILSGLPVTAFDDLDGMHPVLADQEGNIFGARKKTEISAVQQFMYHTTVVSKPLKKNFYDLQVVGPFTVHLELDKKDTQYKLYFLSRVNPQKEIISYIFDRPYIIILFVMIISTPLLWWLSSSIGRPLRHLQEAANAVALGNFKVDRTLETQGSLELRQVGQSFNRMTIALEDLLSNQQTLLSSISHELRTPLTRLQLALALLRRRINNNAEIERIEKEAIRLDEMINDLLLLSRQKLNSHILREIFPITEIWQDIIKDSQFEAEQRQLAFKVHQLIVHPSKHYINGNKALLCSAVENILRNALKYTKSKIETTIFIEAEMLVIAIDDDGDGIPDEEYTNIFKPFYRIDEARTRETGGTGLGLAIVANVVNEHQGYVIAMRSELGGLRVKLSLPLWIFQ
ncbi:envelope stress sensor histidine kinase CpxA [Avibacterium avium]|uniref:envelope stress sensor histidine kinase CpxA n=1 Tax=Avibacterium avium TaxID=751 RepID=UPI003BF7C2D8